ncbi:Golgi membrane protein 1, partial [Camelus dromedarius]
AVLVNNITTGERLIRTLQDQLKALQKNYGKLQQEVLQFQKNQSNLERKFSYDLNQCINQMQEAKEQCDERIEEVTKKGNAAGASRAPSEQKDQSQQPRAASEPQPRPQEAVPPRAGDSPSKGEPQTPAPGSEAALDLKRHGEKGPPPPLWPRTVIQNLREVWETSTEYAGMYFGPLEMGEISVLAAPGALRQKIRRKQQKLGADDEYNMDENEAESETDKQAALVGNDKNRNVLNAENQKGDSINLLDQPEKRNQTL